jgi:SAM-dependent methyltransferase
VDASPALVDRVSELLRTRHPGRDLPVSVGDLAALDLPDAAFDGAVCAEVLEHLEDDRAALAELRRVLRPGGVLAVSVPAGPWRYSWVDLWAGHRRRYTAGDLRERLAEAGFPRAAVASWGFPVTVLYERALYRPMLRRRLARAAGGPPAAPGRAARLAAPLLRAVLEADTLVGGRGPGLGLIALAWR